MTARLLQHPGPDNVVLLVKPCLQLHQHRHLLAVFRRLGQGRNNGRIAADPVQGLFDGQDLGIPGRLADELHHRLKGLVWMVQQNVPLTDLVEDFTPLGQLGHRLGCVSGSFQMVKSLQAIKLHKHRQIQGTVHHVYILVLNVKLLFQNVQKPLVTARRHFQTDGLPPLTLFQLLFNLLQQIRRLVLIYGQIRIAHNPVGVCAYDIVVQEELVHVPLNQLLQKNHLPALPPGGKLHNPA